MMVFRKLEDAELETAKLKSRHSLEVSCCVKRLIIHRNTLSYTLLLRMKYTLYLLFYRNKL